MAHDYCNRDPGYRWGICSRIQLIAGHMSAVNFLYQKIMLSQSGEAREVFTYEITAYTAEDILPPMASFPARPN